MARSSNLNFTFCFMGTTHEPLKFSSAKDHGHTYKFQLNHYFFGGDLNMAVVRLFQVMLRETLNHFV
jgi:hypothetical protein